MDEQGFISFNVPVEYCRALIVEARQQNKRGRHKLPVAYAVWRPLIEAGAPSAKEARGAVTMLEPWHFDSETSRLAARGSELYKLPEFDPWLFEPFSSLHPYVHTYLNLSASHGLTAGTGRKRKTAARLTDAQKREQEMLVDSVLDKAVDTRWRLLYDTRLRRQAALFHLVGRQAEADLISAVSSELHPDSGVLPKDQPFLRTLVHRSLERGLVQVMAEMLENASLRSSPLNFFDRGE